MESVSMNSDLLYPPQLSSLAQRLYTSQDSLPNDPFSAILDESIQAFHSKYREHMKGYVEATMKRTTLPEQGLYVLQETRLKGQVFHPNFPHAWRTESTGGYYIRWNNKGIVLNPGPYFLDYFHQLGLHIKDIDIIIVSRANPNAYADIKDIHYLNAQVNKLSSELQIIHYYLIQSAYEVLSPILKPHFREERNTIHPLEFFIDSPEVEKIEIASGVKLHYFSNERNPPTTSLSHPITMPLSLGIRMDFIHNDHAPVHLGYVSGTNWSPFLANDLLDCDLLITGFGHTSSDDYKKIQYNEDSLGYFGCFTLLEELRPRLMLCTEFDGRDGDIRLDIIKKMRQEYVCTDAEKNAPCILPGSTGLFVDLKSFKILCSSTQCPIDLEHIRAVKTGRPFQPFLYLSSNCWA